MEPSYAQHGKAWSESHTSRMLRKFGSQAQFDAAIASQDLPGRGAEVGLDAAGFVQENLSKRQQSDTTGESRPPRFAFCGRAQKRGHLGGRRCAAFSSLLLSRSTRSQTRTGW